MDRRKRRGVEQYNDMVARLLPELHIPREDGVRVLSRTVTFQVTEDCNLACFIAGTKVLMEGFQYKNIEEVNIGDVVISFPENLSASDSLNLLRTPVSRIFSTKKEVRRITTESGRSIICTDEHPFLDGMRRWICAEALVPGVEILVNNTEELKVDIDTVKSNVPLNKKVQVYNLETGLHTYIADDFLVHNMCVYCYQGHKTKKSMSFETAKKAVDMLLSSIEENNPYINPTISPGIIIEFIGGEPFMEIELIDKIVDYFKRESRRLQHPWAEWYCVSICSNGVLYFDERVQNFLMKNKNNISFSVTIDGNKDLHDSCRVFHDGRPSYDLAVAAAIDWMDRGYYMGSKITIAPENVTFLYDALTHMIGLGYQDINANCVYEEGWDINHAAVLYQEMKRVSDYLFDNNLEDDIYISLYEEFMFQPMKEDDNDNWCWGKGTPILTTEGYKPIEEIKIGDYVYTEDGSTHPVINTLSHFADNVVNISMSGVFDLVCTDNHQLFTKPFDYRGWKNLNHYKEKVKSQIKDIQHKDLIELFRLPEGTVNYNTKLAYLVGRYIGDGWHYKDGGLKNEDGSDGYGICCSFDEQKKLECHFSDADVEFCSSKNKTVAQYTISRRDCNNPNNIELLRILSKCGCLAHGKHLPPECFNWTKESLISLINGYMDADGCLDKKKDLYKFNTTSYQLAQELMVILRTIGYSPTCYHNKRGGKNVIQGREVNIRDRYEVYFYKNADKTRYIHESDGNIWSYGLKATPTESQMVYNITVDTNHSYIAGGIASSNCGGTCDMLCIDPDGNYSICIRYLPSSLGDDQPPIYLGNVDRGLVTTKEEKQCVHCMKCITRKSQSTDECFNCPIAAGCAWCSAYNYQITGSVNKRVTYICPMHKARALANVYFWNKYYRKHGDKDRFENYCPDEWALEIISQNELNMLKELAKSDTE